MKIKNLFLTICFLAITVSGFAQVQKVTNLDVSKTLLLPRVDPASVASPVNGMIIYDTTSNCIKGYENGAWSTCYNPAAAAAEASNAALAEILEDSNSTGGANNGNGTPVTVAQLNAITGITNVDPANEAAYQAAINAATGLSNPPTATEVQAVLDAVNAAAANDAALAEVLEDSNSTGGANNGNGTPVTAAQLAAITGITGVDPANEAAYQAAINAATGLSNPPTATEIQAILNDVNTAAAASNAALAEVLEDSASTGGANNGNGTPVTATQLAAIDGVTGVDPANEAAYQAAINAETGFSNPPTATEIQAVLDAVNAAETASNANLAEVLEDSASTGGANDANSTPVTATQLAAITGITGVDPANEAAYQAAINAEAGFSNPPTVTEVQAVLDAVNAAATASTAALAEVLEDSASTGGANDANSTPVTATQLAAIDGITGVDPANEAAYQAAINAEAGFSNPPTVAEVQAVLDAVNAAASCPDASTNAVITGAPTGTVCGGSPISLSVYAGADTYAWTATNGATFDDATSATPVLTLPSADVNVTVNVAVTKTGCTTANATPVVIDVDAAPSVAITGKTCLDVEQTDYDPTNDPLADRVADPDNFTNLAYSVGTSTGAATFAWAWLSNPGNNGTINSGASTHTADVSFNKTTAAVGTYVLQITMTGFTCGTIVRTISIDVRDASCYCPTAVVEVTGAGGKIWMDRNLGAKQAATASNDFNAYGCLFQWGRKNDGHADIDWTSATAGTPVNGNVTGQVATDNVGHTDFIRGSSDWRNPKNDALWQGTAGTNNPCPSGYRLPTDAEWNTEAASWSTANMAGALNSNLKLPAAGNRNNSNATLYNQSSYGLYWSSNVDSANARRRSFNSSSTGSDNSSRANGFSVRCIKD